VCLSSFVRKCGNPWKKDCMNMDVKVYIVHKKQQLPICTQCWQEISAETVEWGDNDGH
jgi:hypothetical protein